VKITVFGATGGIGGHVVRQALDAGHMVTAVVREIRRSATQWTVVRPPKLVDKPLTGEYRIAVGGNVPRGYAISRSDTAHAMLAALDNPATLGQAVGVAY
jgi:uncharacterized protein YbjT (DUF2867 family)